MNIIDKLNSLNVGESCYYMGGITLTCLEDNSDCTCCHFKDKACFPEIKCAAVDREDGKNVVFYAVLDDVEKESEILYVDGILRYKGKQYQLVNGGECYKCDFQRTNEPCSGRMKCTKDSHFKEIINHE